MQRANTQIPLRSSSPASSEAQPDHCRKDVQKVGNQTHSQWHPVNKHREGHLQCLQYPPKRNLGERSSTWGKEKGGRGESSAFRKQPRRSSEEERRGGWRRIPNSRQPPCGLVHLKGEEVVCVKEQHQVRGREGGLKSKGNQDLFFFWTMLRSSLQLWQSWSCAKVVIVRQLDLMRARKESEAKTQQKPSQPKPNKDNKKNQQFPGRSMEGETKWNWNALTTSQN